MGTRIEILKEGQWQSLELADKKAIKYNAVINKIGKVATREISHTNTFSIPYIQQNTNALGINVFNKTTLAKSLNAKFLANYYVEDKLVRTGYVVINNTNGGTININFIDEALELLDKWGSTTYKELLETSTLAIPSDYVSAIEELSYDMDPTNVLTPLSQVGARGYNLALFPNSLNAIGDAFQLDDDELRLDDHFNPFQCRPVWNVKAMFDLACEAYGYTPIFDNSVDWNQVAKMYMIEAGQDKNEKGQNGVQTESYGTVANSLPHYFYSAAFNYYFPSSNSYSTFMLFPSSVSLRPMDIANWTQPAYVIAYNNFGGVTDPHPWMDKNCIFVANLEGSNSGLLTFTYLTGNNGMHSPSIQNLYQPINGCDYPYVFFDDYFVVNYAGVVDANPYRTDSFETLENGTSRIVTIEINKTWFNVSPEGPIGSNIMPAFTDKTAAGPWAPIGTTLVKSSATDANFIYTLNTTMLASKKYFVHIELGNVSGGTLKYTLGSNIDYSIVGEANADRKIDLVPQVNGIGIWANNASTIKFHGDFVGTIKGFWIYELADASVGDYVGTYLIHQRTTASDSPAGLQNMAVTEEWLPPGVVAFDEFGQYLPTNPDLRHAAPRKTVKALISAYMHKDGILMDVNAREKTVKFFNYGEYEENKVAGQYIDWSDYLLKYSPITYNTDYGNAFAKKNRIGLNAPYPGNTYDYVLDNQGEESKFKDFTRNNNKTFKDIENVVSVDNTNNPYFEYTNTGLGLVEYGGPLTGTLTQSRADGLTQGTFSNLALIYNVNGLVLPDGTKYWYDLIDKSVKTEAKFLLPVDRMNQLDMSLPVYIEELGGFFIIEKIEEYVNGQTPVTVKLIKLIDDLRGYIANPVVNSITLSVYSIFPNSIGQNIYQIYSSASFNNYIPTSATITYRQLTDSIENGGTYNGYTVSGVFVFDANTNYNAAQHSLLAQLPMTEFEEGHYEVQVTDDSGLESNLAYGTLGDFTIPPASVSMYIQTFLIPQNSGVASGTFRVDYSTEGHTPITLTLKYRKANFMGGYLAPERTVNLLLAGNETPLTVTPVDGPGFYEISIESDLAESPPGVLSGYFIT